MRIDDIAEVIAVTIEVLGVVVIAGGVVVFTIIGAAGLMRRRSTASSGLYRTYRRRIGRSTLLGLEILVAGDIIRTVALTPTLQDLGVLGGIVAIRTFLSIALEVEIDGRWPWQPVGDRATTE
jgi:uncharacterized membrane protein